jgi:hypothetical protein
VLIEAIDQYLATRPKDKRRIRCFHPSTLHKSAQYLYDAYLNGDNNQDFEPRLLRIFDNGHGVHYRLQRYLKEIGTLVETEVPVENQEYEICGSADGILKLGKREGVLEIKSINANGFYATHEPKPDHIIQINIYMFCLGIPRGCVLYENKNNQELKEFYVKLDNKILDPVLEKIKLVQSWIRGGGIENNQ